MRKTKLVSEIFPRKQAEKEIQQQIGELLVKLGYLVIRFNSGGRFMNGNYVRFYTILNNNRSAGLPDLAFMRNSRIIFVEVKTEKGKLRDTQQEFKTLAANNGIEIWTARSWEEVYEKLSNNNKSEG